MKKIFPFLALVAALAFPVMAQTHYNQITMVDQISTVQTPVVFFFYVDGGLVGSTYIYNGIVTGEFRNGHHHLEARVRTNDGVEHVVYQTDIDQDHYDYTWTIKP